METILTCMGYVAAYIVGGLSGFLALAIISGPSKVRLLEEVERLKAQRQV